MPLQSPTILWGNTAVLINPLKTALTKQNRTHTHIFNKTTELRTEEIHHHVRQRNRGCHRDEGRSGRAKTSEEKIVLVREAFDQSPSLLQPDS